MTVLALATAATVAGTALQAASTIAGGQADYAASKFKAQQLRQQEDEARAVGSREVEQKTRETRRLQSDLQARAAVSGGGLDPTIINLDQGITGEGAKQAMSALATRETEARGYASAADAAIASGKAARTGSYFEAAGQVFSGIGDVAGMTAKAPKAKTIAATGNSLNQKYG